MPLIATSPDKFLAAWRSRLQTHAFARGVFWGMAATAALAFLYGLAGLLFSFPRVAASPGTAALWLPCIILLGGVIFGLFNIWPSKFSRARVARLANHVLPGSRGRLTAWVELRESLPLPWKAAMEREMLHYLSAVEVPTPAWPAQLLRRTMLIVLAGYAGSLGLLLWNEGRVDERREGINAALGVLDRAKNLLVQAAENPDSGISAAAKDELPAFLERESRRLAESRTAGEAEALARGIVTELESRIQEDRINLSPSALAAMATGTDMNPADESNPENASPGTGAANQEIGKAGASQELVEMLASLRGLTALPSPTLQQSKASLQPLASTGSLSNNATAEENAQLVTPESLPGGIRSHDAPGPAVPLSQPPAEANEESFAGDTNITELRLPTESSAHTVNATGAVMDTQMPPEAAERTPVAQSLNWDAVIEEALSQNVPAGSRETVRRYFEKLRATQ